ncbi:MAG: hypothetical protein ACPGSI_09180, partial [Pikeienuella sp.]
SSIEKLGSKNLHLAHHHKTIRHLHTRQDLLVQQFDDKTLDSVGEFLADPLAWSAANGGISEL